MWKVNISLNTKVTATVAYLCDSWGKRPLILTHPWGLLHRYCWGWKEILPASSCSYVIVITEDGKKSHRLLVTTMWVLVITRSLHIFFLWETVGICFCRINCMSVSRVAHLASEFAKTSQGWKLLRIWFSKSCPQVLRNPKWSFHTWAG